MWHEVFQQLKTHIKKTHMKWRFKIRSLKNWEKNEGTLHGFNNCKVLANLNLVTVVTIFSSKIVELLRHYILVQAMVIQTHISMHSIKEKSLLCGRASKFAIGSKY